MISQEIKDIIIAQYVINVGIPMLIKRVLTKSNRKLRVELKNCSAHMTSAQDY